MASPRDHYQDVEQGLIVGSLCTGYGGLDLGVLAALGGGRIAWVADPDSHISAILATRMPGVPNLRDITTVDWTQVEPVHVLTAGFPCQDISAAGKRAGIEKGVRSGLWAEIVAGVRVLRPALVVLENVAALRWRNGGLHRVLGDLAEAGYDALWRSVRAADVGAAHRRERVFVLAWLRQHEHGGSPIAAHADRLSLRELHAPDQDRWTIPTRRGPATADPTGFGHRDGGTQGRTWVPAAVVAEGAPAGGAGGDAADTARHGRDQGLPGAARVEGRSDAAFGGHPPARHAGRHPGRHQDQRHLVAVPHPDDKPVTGLSSEAIPATVNWGGYEAAIRRWESVLGRPAPHPTQPGNHGRPVLAPAFVEHLMGLPAGWVTDLPLPRTAQLRALGNGVVPQQAAYVVSLLLDDLAELLDTDHRPAPGQEVPAA